MSGDSYTLRVETISSLNQNLFSYYQMKRDGFDLHFCEERINHNQLCNDDLTTSALESEASGSSSEDSVPDVPELSKATNVRNFGDWRCKCYSDARIAESVFSLCKVMLIILDLLSFSFNTRST